MPLRSTAIPSSVGQRDIRTGFSGKLIKDVLLESPHRAARWGRHVSDQPLQEPFQDVSARCEKHANFVAGMRAILCPGCNIVSEPALWRAAPPHRHMRTGSASEIPGALCEAHVEHEIGNLAMRDCTERWAPQHPRLICLSKPFEKYMPCQLVKHPAVDVK